MTDKKSNGKSKNNGKGRRRPFDSATTTQRRKPVVVSVLPVMLSLRVLWRSTLFGSQGTHWIDGCNSPRQQNAGCQRDLGIDDLLFLSSKTGYGLKDLWPRSRMRQNWVPKA